jgi:hypothetical protein
MKISVDFPQLQTLVRRMGAAPVQWKSGGQGAAPPDWADILLKGVEIALEDVEVVDGLLAYQGEQVLLYIKDTRQDKDTLLYNTEKARRFHVADCATLENMREQGRYERYVVTNNTSGVFDVDAMDPDTREREAVQSELKVCKNCLKALDYKGYQSVARKKGEIWRGFAIDDFFQAFRSRFRKLPQHSDQTAPIQGYPKNWPKISLACRERAGWKCESCRVDLSSDRALLDAHHRNGQTADNSWQNLMALCKICHSEQPQHRMRVSPSERARILRLRREQGI